jgi:putative DNA primase/helicase
VETALSANKLLGAPAWAALSAHNLAQFQPPDPVRVLVIACDRDPAGVKAARALVNRVQGALLRVRVVLPPGDCNDWNDALNKRAAEEGCAVDP